MVTPSLQIYANVKSYSIKGKLLRKKDFQTLSESRDIEELVTRLKNTSYSGAITEIQKPYSAKKIENALRKRQIELHHTMIQASGGSKVLYAYYLKFILHNLKIILKGKILNKTQNEIESYLNLRAEELINERDVVLKAFLAKDIEETVNVLKSLGIGEEVEKAYSLYNEKKQIQAFDLHFDKSFYENLNKTVKNSPDFTIHTLCGMEIDFYNIMTILRGKFWNLDENHLQHLIVSNTSSESREVFTRMIAADSIKNSLSELSSTKYKDLIPQEEDEPIAKFERSFERRIYNTMNAQFVRIFGVSTIIAIVRLIDFEIRNLASIGYGVEQNIPSQTVTDRMNVKD